MPLELSELYNLQFGPKHTAFIAHVLEAVGSYFGCKLGRVSLTTNALQHILKKHPVDLIELLHLPDLIRDGLWIAERDKPLAACVLYQVPGFEARYKAALEFTEDRCEIYVLTFHKTRKRQTKAILKRGNILQTHR